jgi:hypothetical protein
MLSRIVNAVILVVLGAVAAAVGTVAHQATVALAGAPLPWGLVLSLCAVACLLAGLRLVAESRVPAFAAALGVVGMIGLFSLRSMGGSVLIPNNLVGQLWVFGPVVIAAIVIAWPRVSRHRGDAQAITAGVN